PADLSSSTSRCRPRAAARSCTPSDGAIIRPRGGLARGLQWSVETDRRTAPMREDAADLTLIVDALLGPEPADRGAPAQAAWPAAPEPSALRELMSWVSDEVFGRAEG